MGDQIMTTKELADYIKLNEKTVIKLVQYGELPGFKVGNQWRFHLAAVDHYLQKQLLEAPDDDLDLIIKTKGYIIPLSRLTDKTLIELDMRAENKNQVWSRLAKMAYLNRLTPSYEGLYLALEEREKMASTAVGQGVALPHPRFPHHTLFKKPNIVIARVNVGIQYDAPDHQKVYLFFMPCAPTQFVHVRLLAKISKLLHVPHVIEQFKLAKKSEDIIRILMAFEQSQILPDQRTESGKE